MRRRRDRRPPSASRARRRLPASRRAATSRRHHRRAGARRREPPAGLVIASTHPPRSSSARTRRTSTRSCAISATGAVAASTCVEHLRRGRRCLVLEAVADARTPAARRVAARRGERRGERHVGVDEQRQRVAGGDHAQRPARRHRQPATHDPRRRSERVTGDRSRGARRRAAHSSATCASSRSLAARPAAPARGRRARAPPRAARRPGATAAAARPSGVRGRDDARGRLLEAARVAARPLRAPTAATRAAASPTRRRAPCSKPSSPRRAATGGPSDAASVRVVSMRGIQPPRRANARRAGASICDERQQDDGVAQRARLARSPGDEALGDPRPTAATSATSGSIGLCVAIGKSEASGRLRRERLGQNDCAFRRALADSLCRHRFGAGTRTPS